LGTWQPQDPRSKTLLDGGDGCVANRETQADLTVRAVDIRDVDPRRPVLINIEPFLHTSNQSTKMRVQSVTERRRPDDNRGETERLVGPVLDHDAVHSAHLAAVSIDHALIQHVANDIHVNLRRSPAG
jgi:hypothetical protein